MKNRNVTGIVVAIIYCIVLYGILIEAPPGEVPNHPPWAYLMIPLGAIAITALFDFVIKYDFFKKRNKTRSHSLQQNLEKDLAQPHDCAHSARTNIL
ncbi:hypothetical protein [Paenibacillus sp. VMFN-D1]|uniref:hypothetical protein n=1 Tax=Paenibacillus sp. VMFN-D1 TaxID=2135608 RepID=UPI000E3628C8|nr:hypothetical protein [Paenibacillus sp. VMFN-D1]RED36574.1 hypothetical protein C7820_3346 [Paenibacillus sp. VMFN-D1]